jgi:hypothetical protein
MTLKGQTIRRTASCQKLWQAATLGSFEAHPMPTSGKSRRASYLAGISISAGYLNNTDFSVVEQV